MLADFFGERQRLGADCLNFAAHPFDVRLILERAQVDADIISGALDSSQAHEPRDTGGGVWLSR